MQETYRPTQKQQNYQTQRRMSVPPTRITTKDLAYLKDAMSWELLAMKKCNQFANECRDNEIRDTINQTGKLHAKHYKILLKHTASNKNMKTY